MIRGLRLASIVLCIISVLVYGGVNVYTGIREDRKGPAISMAEKTITISTEDGEDKILSGIKAVDERDGDVSELLVVESMSNFVKKGVRDVTIAAFDKSGNVTKTVRKVKYSDYHSPKIKLAKPLSVAANKLGELHEGVSAWDCLDGDISSYVQISSETIVSELTPGTYQMHITVANSAGDVTDLEVPVEVYDYRTKNAKREVLLTEYLVYTKVGEPVETDSYLWGISEDGVQYRWDSENPPEISKAAVSINDGADYDTPGIYEITYAVEDEDGERDSVNQIVVVEK